jgi:hypothetical protein
MPTTSVRLLVLSSALAAVTGCAAGGRGALPADARVETLQTDRMVMRGTAAPNAASVTCAQMQGGSPKYLELKSDETANMVLRPLDGVAVLHVQELATNKTWCVMTKGDGTGAAINGTFPMGVYAISVEASHSDHAMPYAVSIEKL